MAKDDVTNSMPVSERAKFKVNVPSVKPVNFAEWLRENNLSISMQAEVRKGTPLTLEDMKDALEIQYSAEIDFTSSIFTGTGDSPIESIRQLAVNLSGVTIGEIPAFEFPVVNETDFEFVEQ